MPGFPIRTPSDLSSVDSSPRLIAASYVLHRLLMPRHPPCALKNLTTKMLASTVQFSNNHQNTDPSMRTLSETFRLREFVAESALCLLPKRPTPGYHTACSLRTQQHAEHSPEPPCPVRSMTTRKRSVLDTRQRNPSAAHSASSSTWISSHCP